ncbi:MAG: hypothetical protein ABWK15_00540 [Dissulfuribacterales bacterium]
MKKKMLLTAGLFAVFSLNQMVISVPAYSNAIEVVDIQILEPASDFKKAHESFIKKDYKATVNEIRKAADFMKKEAEIASDKGKKAILASADELNALADKIEKGAVKSRGEISSVFARAEHALANNYYLKATDAWFKKETKETGDALKSAANHLEQAGEWSGHKAKAGVSKAIKETKELSNKLIQGTGYVTDDVGKGIEHMGGAIVNLGNKLMGKK